ncbi:MAG: hypothetical protein JWN15_1426 [Firmicutes bacterium]|nr:hypothetical protein [Bacillota bacterium]
MHRTGRTRSKKGKGRASGILKTLAGPVGLVALGLALVLGAGYWAQRAPASKQVPAPVKQAAPSPVVSPQPAPTPAPAAPPTAQPPVTPPKPVPAKPDPNQAILEGRHHIDRAAGAKATMTLTLYYADGLKNGEALQPVEVRVAQSRSSIQSVVEQVINAPADLKLYSSVPAGTKVKSVNLTAGGVAVVDLSAEVAQVRGSAATENIVASLVYSLTELKGVNSVQLWVNGHPAMLDQYEWSKSRSRADMGARNVFTMQPVIKFTAKP